jgi:hypothetical protein
MRNRRGRSSAIALAMTMIVACTKGDEQIVLVRAETYESRGCWFDREGDFVAFLALARDDRLAVPHFISTKCLVNGDYDSDGEATIRNLGTISMVDSYRSLQRAFPTVIMSDNVRTDLPLPSSDSKLYYFRAELRTLPRSYDTVYAPQNIVELTDMHMSFEHFLNLSREQRQRLLADYNQARFWTGSAAPCSTDHVML